MKIKAITPNFNKKNITACSYTLPLKKGNVNDIVSFSSANVDKDDAFLLRNIPNLPCACCGKNMINEKNYAALKSKDFQGPAQQVLKKLKPFYKNMRPTEKTVYNILRRTSNRYPQADLNTLIRTRYYFHLGRLEVKQLNIINKAISQDLNLNERNQKALEKTMKEVRKILFSEPKEKAQKRNRILDEFYILRYQSDEKHKIDKILKVVETLPSSKNDVDSFMIKYAERCNREIGQRLLSPSLPTLDHIKPASKSGPDDFSNLLVLCAKCNEERGVTPYTKWFSIHPEMKKNIKRNISKIVEEINKGNLENFKNYPSDIKNTLEKETKNQYILDIK